MQNGIPLAYNFCEVRYDKTSIWMCKYREEMSVAVVF